MPAEEIFVFGSNLAGVHGAGAARHAYLHHGAVYGIGVGIQGSSYGIPTKDRKIKTLPLAEIRPHVDAFLDFSRQNPGLTFRLTAVGCGLAGYKPEQIAPMFRGAPPNVIMPPEFAAILGGTT